MQNINLNDKVPNFELEGTSNLAFNLKNFLGKYKNFFSHELRLLSCRFSKFNFHHYS